MESDQTNQVTPEAEKPKTGFEQATEKLKEIKLPKINFSSSKISIWMRIRNKFKEYARVLKITKKPDRAEFKTTVKAAGIGLIIIGVIGFIISIIAQVIMS